jgi:hypothetical protein
MNMQADNRNDGAEQDATPTSTYSLRADMAKQAHAVSTISIYKIAQCIQARTDISQNPHRFIPPFQVVPVASSLDLLKLCKPKTPCTQEVHPAVICNASEPTTDPPAHMSSLDTIAVSRAHEGLG